MEVFMLGRKQRRHTVVETLVGSNTRISGDLHFTGGCHIDGTASQRVELGPTARVIGNVYYNLIEMAIGAEINGKLVHQPEGQVPLLEQTARIDESAALAAES
jgi:cytoskeletal protein CcmA (bactofilin family)